MSDKPWPQTADLVHRTGLICETRDGVHLVADAWHPPSGGPWPVLLQRLPYGRAVASTPVLPHPAWFARRGYAVVVQDARGRGESTGSFEPFVHESADGFDAVRWAAGLPFANGDVALYGFSYQGWSQLATAAARPPQLRAIAPMMCGPDPYEGWTYDGGCLRWPFVLFWSAQLRSQETGVFVAGDPAALPITAAFGDDPPRWFVDWLAHPERDGYWDDRTPDLGAIDVPALCVLGYFDDFAAGCARVIAQLDAEAVCGPWEHMPWGTRVGGMELGEDAGPQAVPTAMLDFFDRVLKTGAATPVEKVRYYSAGTGWRSARSWPPPHELVRLSANSGGNANSRHGDGRLVFSDEVTPTRDMLVVEPLVPYPGDAGLLTDEGGAEDRRDVLCYTTSPFPDPIRIAGAASVDVTVSCDRPSHDIVASLVVVTRDGTPLAIARGSQRSAPHPAGEAHHMELTLQPVGWTVQAGERLRLDVSGARFPAYDRNLHGVGVANRDAGPAEQHVATLMFSSVGITLPVESVP